MNFGNLKILFIQRVITDYRLDLLEDLTSIFKEVGIISAKLPSHDYSGKLIIHEIPSIPLNYSGDSRSTTLFLYPKSVLVLNRYDIIVFEGTTNILNNFYLVPIAKLLKKKLIWWDAGYSLNFRSTRRKIIDQIMMPFIKMTDLQMTYSSKAKDYLEKYMGATKAFRNLNTIQTSYFDAIKDEIEEHIKRYDFDINKIKILFVGIIEKRKKIDLLIDTIKKLNAENNQFELEIIGGGNYLEELKQNYVKDDFVTFLGPIYDKESLKPHYFKNDIFILPGDGGLAIVQSMLFGLPVVCVKGADGTELDYITNKEYLLDNIIELPVFLQQLSSMDRAKIYKEQPNLSSKIWTNNLIDKLANLY